MNYRIKKEAKSTTGNVSGLTVECKIHFKNGHRGRKRIRQDEALALLPVVPGNIPRISRLMALAIRFEGLVQRGEVQDYADLARLGMISRARITQIINLLYLAPDIQEDILFLPRVFKGKEPITERDIRPIVAIVDWAKQRRMWKKLQEIGMLNLIFSTLRKIGWFIKG